MAQILVVNSDGVAMKQMLNVLNGAGHQARGASTFEEAKRALATGAPDLVIADERLGAYNGLHVIVRARAEYPDVGAIVTTPVKNRGLEADARSLNVLCLIKPLGPTEWLKAIWRMLNPDGFGARAATGCGALQAVGRI